MEFLPELEMQRIVSNHSCDRRDMFCKLIEGWMQHDAALFKTKLRSLSGIRT